MVLIKLSEGKQQDSHETRNSAILTTGKDSSIRVSKSDIQASLDENKVKHDSADWWTAADEKAGSLSLDEAYDVITDYCEPEAAEAWRTKITEAAKVKSDYTGIGDNEIKDYGKYYKGTQATEVADAEKYPHIYDFGEDAAACEALRGKVDNDVKQLEGKNVIAVSKKMHEDKRPSNEEIEAKVSAHIKDNMTIYVGEIVKVTRVMGGFGLKIKIGPTETVNVDIALKEEQFGREAGDLHEVKVFVKIDESDDKPQVLVPILRGKYHFFSHPIGAELLPVPRLSRRIKVKSN